MMPRGGSQKRYQFISIKLLLQSCNKNGNYGRVQSNDRGHTKSPVLLCYGKNPLASFREYYAPTTMTSQIPT